MAINRFSIRRGNTATNNAYKGYAGELTINTETKTIRVHDGTTVGGTELVTTVFNNFSPTNASNFNNQDVSDINNLSTTNLTVSGVTDLQNVTIHQNTSAYGDLTLLNSPNLYVLGAGFTTMFSVNGTNGNTYIGGDLSANSNVTITGNLTVNGTTTTINSTTQTLDDPIFTLGGDSAPNTDDSKDRGIEFRWHNGVASKVGFFGFYRSTQKFTFIPDATNTGEVFSGSAGNVIFSTGDFTSLSTTDLTVTNTITGSISGSATTLATPRQISLGGDLSGSANFNGGSDITITATIQANSVALGSDTTGNYVQSLVQGAGITLSNNDGESATPTIALTSGIATAGTYKSVTVDTYGRVTAGTNPTTLAGYGISDAQPLDATLTALAGVTTLADKLIYATASDTFTTTDLTLHGRTLIGGADASASRLTLGLVIGTNVQAWDADLDAIAVLAGTSGYLKKTALNTWELDTSTFVDTSTTQNSIGGAKTFTAGVTFSSTVALGGSATATTPSALDNSLKVATTAYVQNATRVSTNTQTANYSLVLADEGKMIIMNSASATTVTIPLNSSQAFINGTQIIISRLGNGTVNVFNTVGVTLYSVSSNKYIANVYGAVTLIKTATDTWYMFGDLSAT